MRLKEVSKKVWRYLNKDSWDSWLVSLVLIAIVIKFIFFPTLALVTGSPLPLVVVESCSMYHESNFEEWWSKNANWYETRNITKEEFLDFQYKNGINKGDIFLVIGKRSYSEGDIIIFKPNTNSTSPNPLIHRLIQTSPYGTKGDHNSDQLTGNNNNLKTDERSILDENVLGKVFLRIPFVGWAKLIFFEPLRQSQDKGFCK